MTRYLIIVNPTSGRGAGGRSIPLIEKKLRGLGLDFDLVRTECPWHAVELAQRAAAEHYDVVVAAGGDGTANEVLNGLMLAKQATVGPVETPPVGRVPAPAVGQLPFRTAMGVLCVGRGNDFAYGVDIPADLDEACKLLAEDHRKWIDVGRVEGGLYPQGRYFGNGVGIGFDAVVGFVAVRLKPLSGFASYILAALETTFLYYKAPRVKVAFEGQTLELPALMISIMNGRRLGGGFYMAPHGAVDDGYFDVIVAEEVSRARIFSLIPHFMKGTQASQPEIKTLRARQLTVTATQGVLPAHADGETLCTDGQQLILELLPQQLQVITCARP